MKKWYLFFFLCISLCQIQAQTLQLKGDIQDKNDSSALPGATIALTTQGDTTQKSYQITNPNGQFVFPNLQAQTYILTINYIGYKTLRKIIAVSQEQQTTGILYLTPLSQLLNEVNIKGKKYEERTAVKGDTTEYNANAFKTNPDATAEDLISKMPGITVENGAVKAQGEDVKKVLIDGKEFFGDDATLALRNLPSEVIDKIQVFDNMSEQSQFTGFDDGQSVKTINIVTKPDKRNGQFGKVFAGIGHDGNELRYLNGGNINLFKNDTRLSILGISNNINQQNFATQDLLGAFSSNGSSRGGGSHRGGSRGGGSSFGGGGADPSNFLIGQQNGISTTNSIGLNYSDSWGKKITVNGNYFFNKLSVGNQQASTREYILSQDSSQFYKDEELTTNTNLNNRFNMRVEYKIDSANSIVISPKFSFQTNSRSSELQTDTRLENQTPLNNQYKESSTEKHGYNLSNEILFRHRFTKPGRSFSVSVMTGLNKNDSETLVQSLTQSYQNGSPLPTIRINQQTIGNVNGYNLSGNLSYTEPLSRRSMLQVNYFSAFSSSESEQKARNYDESTGDYTILNTRFSNTFNNDRYTNRAGLSYRARTEKLMLSVNLSAQRADLIRDQSFPVNNSFHELFYNVLPSVISTYKFNKEHSLRLFYRTSADLPSITQLQNVLNNTNPLLLSTGNPDLKQEYTHSFVSRYSAANTDKARSTLVFVSLNYTNNYIGNATIIANKDTTLVNGIQLPGGGTIAKGARLQTGGQLSYPVNLSGNWNVRSLFTYGFPIGFLKSNVNWNTGINHSRNPALINDTPSLVNTYAFSQGLVISSNISEKIDFTVSYNANYTIVENSLQPQLNNNYFYHTLNGKFNLIFGKGFVYQTNLLYTQYTGLAGSFNQQYTLWNMSFGKKFFKKQNGELKLSVFDLLNENNSISRNVTETYIEDTRTQVLKQYYLLTFTYTLRRFGAGKKAD